MHRHLRNVGHRKVLKRINFVWTKRMPRAPGAQAQAKGDVDPFADGFPPMLEQSSSLRQMRCEGVELGWVEMGATRV